MDSVLFIMNYSIHNTSRRKYDDQMRAVSRLGYDVWHLGIDDEYVYLCHGEDKTRIYKRIKSYIQSAEENVLYISLFNSVKYALKLKPDFKFCYIRRYYIEAAALRAFKRLRKHGVYTIVEIPTYPHKSEMSANASLMSRFFVAYGEHYEKKSAKYIDLFCPMGEHADKIYGAPALNIENGIDVSDIKMRNPRLKDNEYHIIALALMTYWHGYDRLITGLAEYKKTGNERIYIHLAGEGSVLSQWRKLSEELGVSEYVIFEGKMNNVQMNERFDEFDLGAASLGRYRSGLSVVYELKTREYMARGLPFIYATDDYVVHEFGKYCVRVPNDDSPIDMNMLIEFMKKMKNTPEACSEMRRYAEEKMSFDIQFDKIFKYFKAFSENPDWQRY